VNLVGFVWGQSGLGEDVRTMSAALNAVGLPHVMIDATDEDQELRPAEAGQIPVSDRPVFATSVYCMSAFNMATLYVTRGPDFFAGQYRIGYCPWELNCFPDIWTGVYELMDEIWTGSEFTARAYRTNCPKPVLCLPAPVTVPSVQPRAHVKISKDAFVFTYPFDPNSCLARKNPIALVRAFRLAFPRKDRMVALLLRINGELAGGPDRSALLREIGTDKRIVVMEGTLDRIDALCLTASCDCLVSPHRAEGFGRNIAEAILLKVPVLATAFSGCNDFLAPEEGLAFNLQEVRPGQYPFGEGLGLFWAEPVVTDMAEKMKLMRATKRRRTGKGRERLVLRARQIAEHYAPLVAVRAVVARLEALQLVSRTRAN
jgi:glycosyltransferase involved in cell wall biosynthesis